MDLIIPTFTDKWDDWEREGFPSRSGALCLALAAHPRVHRVLVVDVPTSFASALRRETRFPARFTVRRERQGVFVLDHVRALPRERHYPAALALNAALHDGSLASRVRRAAAELRMRAPVALHEGPLTAGLFGKLGESLRVYDAVDEWRAHPAFHRMRPVIDRAYATIRAQADLVVAVSSPLADAFRGGSAEVAVVRNGVGEEFCDPALADRAPADLDALPRPIVGYTGALEDRFDAELLEWLALAMPSVTFCLVGPVSSPDHFRRLASIPNVRFLGPKNHDVLAGYVRSFDVCMMPHLDTPLTRMMDPIKLREYIASGRPVVMSAVGEWRRFQGLVRVAHSREGFKEELERVSSQDPPGVQWGAAWAERHSWARRAGELVELIERLRCERDGRPASPAPETAEAGAST